MDNRLVLTVLFVTLSWISAGTYAQNNTTTAATMTSASTATTAAATSASTATTAAATSASNATTAAATSASNATTAAATSASNATTAAATSASNATTAAATSASNATTAAATSASNATTAATTTAGPLKPNTTVETLKKPVSRAGCGTNVLCAAKPAECDPSTSSCFFLNARQMSGNNFEFALSGESEGYIAATLSFDDTLGGNDTTYVCANNNSVVIFFATFLNNGQLTETELNVNSVKGRVNGSNIQCTFSATVPVRTRAARGTRASVALALAVSTGSFNRISGALGSPSPEILSPIVDLANPNATVTNNVGTTTTTTTSPTTTSPTTTSHGITLRQSLMQAVLITVGVLGLYTL